ncbi:hypothetical protein GQR58_013612 [Nymphon striatum]|nr:hypothetical protein GQR58_013612 [Nymphon striatum]
MTCERSEFVTNAYEDTANVANAIDISYLMILLKEEMGEFVEKRETLSQSGRINKPGLTIRQTKHVLRAPSVKGAPPKFGVGHQGARGHKKFLYKSHYSSSQWKVSCLKFLRGKPRYIKIFSMKLYQFMSINKKNYKMYLHKSSINLFNYSKLNFLGFTLFDVKSVMSVVMDEVLGDFVSEQQALDYSTAEIDTDVFMSENEDMKKLRTDPDFEMDNNGNYVDVEEKKPIVALPLRNVDAGPYTFQVKVDESAKCYADNLNKLYTNIDSPCVIQMFTLKPPIVA